jgi:outer membrane protein TolC
MQKLISRTFLAFLSTAALQASAEPLSLERCLALAAPKSMDLRSADLELKAAQADAKAAEAAFYPSLSAQGSEILLGDAISGTRIDDPVKWTTDTYQGSLDAKWNLFRSGKDAYTVRAARQALEGARQNAWRAKQDLGLQVLKAYYDLLKQRHLLEVAKRDLVQKQDSLDQAKRLYDSGSRSRSDLVRQQVQVNLSQRELSNQEILGLAAAARMASLLGLDISADVELVDSLGDTRPVVSEAKSAALALERRPELKALRAALGQADSSVALANLARLPALSLDLSFSKDLGRYGRDSALWSNVGRGDENSTWSTLLSLNVPLFQGFGLVSAVTAAEARRDKAQAILAEAERQALLDVRLAGLTLEQRYKNLALDAELVEAAELSLAEVKRGYQNGTASLFELNDADAARLRAQIEQLNGIYDYQLGRAEWKKALGLDLWQAEEP